MKKFIVTIGAAGLLSGCNAATFGAAKGNGADGSAFGTIYQSSDDPSVSAACNDELKKRGLKYNGGWWRKQETIPCGYMGVGYIESEVEVNVGQSRVCENLAVLDQRMEQQSSNARMPGMEIPLGGGGVIRWNEKEKHCAQSSRCGNSKTPAQAMGRLVWVKKCENTVPEFKTFLDGIRKFENCDPTAVAQNPFSPTCLFTTYGSPIFPLVRLNGSAVDNAPAPAVSGATPSKIDDLAQYVGQVSDPCPEPDAVTPIDSVCTSGCYRADQRLLTSAEGKYEGILDAKNAGTAGVAVLSRASTLENPTYANAPVGRFVASVEDSKEILLTFATASGARLTVTTNHPLVDGQGFMREADSFKVGEPLVRLDGQRDPIVNIGKEEFFGKVYNVAPVSPAPEDNLVVSEGLINGSHNYQTVLRSRMNRQVLRTQLSKGF